MQYRQEASRRRADNRRREEQAEARERAHRLLREREAMLRDLVARCHMKPLTEQDHYEVLEVPRGASPEELRRAYQLAASTYRQDSMAGYSIFEKGDVEVTPGGE